MTGLEELKLKAAGAQHNFGVISHFSLEASDEIVEMYTGLWLVGITEV